MPDANSIKIDSYPPKWLKIENHNLNNSKYNLNAESTYKLSLRIKHGYLDNSKYLFFFLV